MKGKTPAETIAAYRSFNRYYTRKIGVLGEGLLDSPYSLVEARILFELGSRRGERAEICASDLQAELGLDPGYLSRTLGRLEKAGILERKPSAGDGRRRSIALTREGARVFKDLDGRSSAEAAETLSGIGEARCRALASSMKRIEEILERKEPPEILLREPEPGDLGWVVSAHGELYAREYGWGAPFEALVAGIVAGFAAKRDPARERAWIALADGERVGSIFVVEADESTAKLRLLLLAPEARGLGLGKRLVDESLAFARRAGYRKARLWTNDSLAAARGIYASRGFRLVSSEPELLFGEGTMSETWELGLQDGK